MLMNDEYVIYDDCGMAGCECGCSPDDWDDE